MPNSKLKKIAANLLRKAKIEIDGPNPWDIRVKNDNFYERVLSEGNLGLGESYMDGWWEAGMIDEMIDRILRAKLDQKVSVSPGLVFEYLKTRLLNRQNKNRAFEIGERHYDLGNDLYQAMLDKRLVYTCAYFKDTSNLDMAQEKKLDLVCKKIELKPGDEVLDIGCGFGSFAKFAAEKYGAKVLGITVSKEQAALAKKIVAGLPVQIELKDYRDLTGKYDHVVSLGMVEHVGYKNYRTYMKVVHRLLKNDGLFLLQTISGSKTSKVTDRWIEKYIFPNSLLPSLKQLVEASEGLFVSENLHNFGPDYDKTLMAWFENFKRNWGSIKDKYSERFFRMWKYYLLSCAGTFRARSNQLWQIVFSKNGVKGGYRPVY